MAREISLKQFLQIFKDQINNSLSTNKYCFLLGAGASVSSGIPSGWTLANKWFNEIKEILEEEKFNIWIQEKKINKDNLASSYSAIYEKRFEVNKSEGYFEIQKNLENNEPSIGYAYLAKILSESNHKFVITTNFDSLIEDSLFLYTSSKPLVCGHESLASYIDTHTNRPTIVKIHRDVLLEPFSEEEKIDKLKKQWKDALKPLVSNFHLIVVGYAGNDGSLMDYLSEIKDRKNIYWCKRESSTISNEKINTLLSNNDFIVNIDGFDSLMIEIKSSLNISNIKTSDIRELAEKRISKFEEQEKKFADKINENKTEVTDAIKNTLPSWIDKYIEIEKEKDIEKKDLLFKKTVEKVEYKELNHYYALFLKNIIQDYDRAEIYYKKALEIDPNDANINGNYAIFLNDNKHDYDNAEIYYKKALEIDSKHANNISNYALFLNYIRHDYDNAEIYYKKAFEIDPNNANNIANYTSLLFVTRKDGEAKIYLEKSFNLNKIEKHKELEIELWFYVLAHIQERYEEAKYKINELLGKGYKSIGWDFSLNIERAIEDNHPYIDELEKYADLITKE